MRRSHLTFLVMLLFSACFSLLTYGCPNPKVFSLSTYQGRNNEVIYLTVSGAQFHKSTFIKLMKQGQPDIIASDVVISKNQVTCSLDLRGREPGKWDVMVANIGTFTKKIKPTVLPNAFTITYPDPAATTAAAKPLDQAASEASRADTQRSSSENSGDIAAMQSNPSQGATAENMSESGSIAANPSASGTAAAKSAGTGSTPANQSGNGPTAPQSAVADASRANPAGSESVPKGNPNDLLKPIFFDYDKADIRPDQLPDLELDLQLLKENSLLYIMLGGNADERGSALYNLELSARRANTVKNYLLEHGIDANQLVVYAYGKEYPVRKGHDESSWWYNRRVDISLWETPPSKEQGIREIGPEDN